MNCLQTLIQTDSVEGFWNSPEISLTLGLPHAVNMVSVFLFSPYCQQVSSVAAFPLALQPILNEVKRTGRRVTSIKRVGLSGGTPPKSIFEDIRCCLNCECAVHAYGLTETLGPIAVTLPGQDLANCVGFPLPGCRIKVCQVYFQTQDSQ